MHKTNAICSTRSELKNEVRVIIVYDPVSRSILIYSDDIDLQAALDLLLLTFNSMEDKYGRNR